MWPILVFTIFVYMTTPVSLQINCKTLRDNFATSLSDFTACAIYNSRPVTLCESCVQSFINITENYNNMKQVVDNKTLCIDQFINLDRLQIVENLYMNSYNLWNKAKCSECFQIVNGSLTPNKSTTATTFNNYYQNFMECINQSGINKTEICYTCMEAYINVSNYYSTITDQNEDIGGCMDVVDLMNGTQSVWSKNCCKYRRHNESIFIASTVTVLIFTLCFYVFVQFCSVKKAPTILQQRRFAESLSQPTRS